jgi:hypothetical protein
MVGISHLTKYPREAFGRVGSSLAGCQGSGITIQYLIPRLPAWRSWSLRLHPTRDVAAQHCEWEDVNWERW